MLAERLSIALLWTVLAPLVTSTSITEIQGIAYRSPLAGQNVSGVTGIVTAKVCPFLYYALLS